MYVILYSSFHSHLPDTVFYKKKKEYKFYKSVKILHVQHLQLAGIPVVLGCTFLIVTYMSALSI